MSKWEGRMATFDSTSSDYSREHMVTFENLGNLIGDISGQLFQQQAVAHIPYYIQKMTGGDVKKVTDLSKNLALAYMAATSAQDTYSAFKEAGANDRAAGLGMLASTASLYKLMNIDYYTLCVFSILLPIYSCSSISSCQFNKEVLSCKIWSNLYIDTYILCLWVLVNFEIGVFLYDSTRSLVITQERMYVLCYF